MRSHLFFFFFFFGEMAVFGIQELIPTEQFAGCGTDSVCVETVLNMSAKACSTTLHLLHLHLHHLQCNDFNN